MTVNNHHHQQQHYICRGQNLHFDESKLPHVAFTIDRKLGEHLCSSVLHSHVGYSTVVQSMKSMSIIGGMAHYLVFSCVKSVIIPSGSL